MLRWRLVGREMNHVVCKWDLRYVSNKFELTSLTLLHTSKIVTEAYQVKRISFTHPQNGFACFSMGTARDIFAFTSFLLVSGTLLEDFPAFRLVLNWQQGLLSIWDAASDFNSENTLARAEIGYAHAFASIWKWAALASVSKWGLV